MTWYFDPSGKTMDVYDHNGSLVAQDRDYGRLVDGEMVYTWEGEAPQEVYKVMDEEAVKAFPDDTIRILQLLRHGSFELVEQGTPP